jgi:hypothetical protein
MVIREFGRMVGLGGGKMSDLANVFWWIVGIGGMVCAGSCLDSKDWFMKPVTWLNSVTMRSGWAGPG